MGRVRGHRTWSVARSEAFRACPRGFWFRYCSDGESEERQVRLLRHLTTPSMEAGAIVQGLSGAPAGLDMVVAAPPALFGPLHDALVELDAAGGF